MAKYKVNGRILDGSITLDQVFENFTDELAIAAHPVKDKNDFMIDSKLDSDQVNMLTSVFEQLLNYNKIEAIKIVRILTCWTLLEAKEFIESL